MTTEPSPPTARARFGSRLLVAILIGLFLLSVVAFAVAVIDAQSRGDGSSDESEAPALGAGAEVVRLAVADPTAVPATPLPSTAPAVALDDESVELAVVPVAGFWTRADGISRREIRDALETGRADGYDRVAVDERLAPLLAASLGVELHEDVRVRDVPRVERIVARGGLGLLAATDVAPRVKALKVNGVSLYGNERISSLRDWPLTVQTVADAGDTLPIEDGSPGPAETDEAVDDADADAAPAGTDRSLAAWDPSKTWVLVAGGDSFTDRGVYDNVVNKGRGVDFPFDGGTAKVTGHGCCDPVFNDNIVPRYELTGNKGKVRKLFRSAELAIANHEAPVTEGWAFHTKGFRFSGKPSLTRVFTRAGIDWVSLANNHIKDYGTDGIADTRRILKRFGIAFSGAGKDLDQARKNKPLEIGDVKVAIIPCVGVARAAWAGPETSGGTPCLDRYIVRDIKKASKQADLVIVFPHWGVEYTRKPLPSMRKHAQRWVKAGADLILGAHSHVAGAIEEIDGAPVLYSLGNLIFDQHWSTNTMESFILEATFDGDRLAQLRLHPYIVHAQSQPNLLDPKRGEGRRLLKEVKAASSSWLDW